MSGFQELLESINTVDEVNITARLAADNLLSSFADAYRTWRDEYEEELSSGDMGLALKMIKGEVRSKTFEGKVNEMKDTPLITITKILDDDTGIWANDEFEFAIEMTMEEEQKKDPEFKKRVAKFMRETADMLEKQGAEQE